LAVTLSTAIVTVVIRFSLLAFRVGDDYSGNFSPVQDSKEDRKGSDGVVDTIEESAEDNDFDVPHSKFLSSFHTRCVLTGAVNLRYIFPLPTVIKERMFRCE